MSRVGSSFAALALLTACGGKIAPFGEEVSPREDIAEPAPPEAVPPPAPEPTPEPRDTAPTTRSAPGPLVCHVLAGNRILIASFPGAAMQEGPMVELDTFDVSSMGRMGAHLFVCTSSGGDGIVARVSIDSGVVERSRERCLAVSADARGIDVLARSALGETLQHFSDWDAVNTGAAARSVDFPAQVSRIASFYEQVIGSWTSSRTLEISERESGVRLGSRELERPGEWIAGLAPVADGRVLISGRERGIDVFDLFTGEWLEHHAAFHNASALHCAPSYAPAEDSCSGREDGVYCSRIDYAQAYRCRDGQRRGALSCEGAGVCQTDRDSAAEMQGESLRCSPLDTRSR